ncbi:hypothetical protein Dsin_014307 [Dipteronia sinensis]|uniref:Myb-related protein 123 n=1 Tax=Dipteronia sinensis TaxID=43782 RepID=A0AAE0AM01_9ROSI|nr:hypothetical protein Dsin_014307 [Dipteronia sinensis]
MGRSPCCAKEGLNRGAWTATEDKILTDYIKINGEGKWRNLPKRAGLKRCGKSCRLRWLNYLRPDIKRGNISRDEEELIIRLHKLLGNRWALIAGRLPGRTDNEIKNYWNTNIGKKLQDHHQQQNPSPEKPNFDLPRKSITMPTDFQPIRTKASKCTKVIITTPEPQKCSQHYYPDTKQVMVAVEPDHDNNVIKGLDSFPEFNLGDDENHNSSDYFLKDFEMEENFLSEFLNGADFSQLAANNFDTNGNGGDNNSTSSSTTTNNTGCERGYASPNSDYHQDDKLQDSDFSFMDSIIGSEFGWFCD